MDELKVGVIIFLGAVLVGYILWLRWMQGTVRRIAAKNKGGLTGNPGLSKHVQNVYVVHLIFILAQVALCAIAVFTEPSPIDWVIIALLLFAFNFGSRFRAKGVMLRLLGEGNK